MTGVYEILILLLQINLQLHQRSRRETISPSPSPSAWSHTKTIAYLDLLNHPLDTADDSTSSAWDLEKADLSSDTSANARVDPIELTG